MYNALLASLDLSMANARGQVTGHMLLYCPDNEPRRYDARSSNPGALAALNYVCSNVQPRHILRPNDYTSVHRLSSTHWVVECLETGPYSLYHRLSRHAMGEEAVGKYSVYFRLADCDMELHHGNRLHLNHHHYL